MQEHSELSGRINRRKFLGSLGGAILIGAGIELYYRKSDLDRAIESFPEEIEGAQRIDKYPIRGAEKCIVHIRQEHDVENDPKNIVDKIIGIHLPTEAELDRINNIQRNIYGILETLRKEGFTDSIYLEGMPKTFWENRNIEGLLEELTEPDNPKLKKEIKRLRENIGLIPWDIPEGMTPERLIESYKVQLEEKEKELKEFQYRNRFFHGACLLQVHEGKLKPKFFESEKVLSKAKLTYEKSNAYAFEAREDLFLEAAAEDIYRFAVVSLGGAHALGGKESCGKRYSLEGRVSDKDNIHSWNQAHKDRKFSLIEIHPEGY